MKTFLFFLLSVFLVACNSSSNKKQVVEQDESTNYKLELIWESDTTVRTPESVLIDRERDILYVSCINANQELNC